MADDGEPWEALSEIEETIAARAEWLMRLEMTQTGKPRSAIEEHHGKHLAQAGHAMVVHEMRGFRDDVSRFIKALIEIEERQAKRWRKSR